MDILQEAITTDLWSQHIPDSVLKVALEQIDEPANAAVESQADMGDVG